LISLQQDARTSTLHRCHSASVHRHIIHRYSRISSTSVQHYICISVHPQSIRTSTLVIRNIRVTIHKYSSAVAQQYSPVHQHRVPRTSASVQQYTSAVLYIRVCYSLSLPHSSIRTSAQLYILQCSISKSVGTVHQYIRTSSTSVYQDISTVRQYIAPPCIQYIRRSSTSVDISFPLAIFGYGPQQGHQSVSTSKVHQYCTTAVLQSLLQSISTSSIQRYHITSPDQQIKVYPSISVRFIQFINQDIVLPVQRVLQDIST
jgi:hypothetical protein